MSKRLWLLGVVGLVIVGLLVACGSNYNRSQDGLLLVGSQGSALIQTYSFTLSNGHISSVANPPSDTANQTCVLNGLPSDIIMDPSGAYAYSVLNQNSSCSSSSTGIQAFKVNPSGTTSTAGSLQPLNQTTQSVIVGVDECGTPAQVQFTVTVAVLPVQMAINSAGKYLYVADKATSTTVSYTPACSGIPVNVSVPVPGTVSAFSIGGNGTLTEVTGSPFTVPVSTMTSNLVALAVTPTTFPGIGINGSTASVCSVGNPPPTSEFLYVVDSTNYVVWEFAVNTSTGALGNPQAQNGAVIPSTATDQVPAGVAVDPCDRFVYVSDSLTNKISAYTIRFCMSVPSPCPFPDGSLNPVPGSPFALSGNANQPGPIVVDPYGNNVYAVGVLSNTVSMLKITPTTGALTALNPPVIATGDHGMQPGAITIRGDDNWMFVSNYNAATVSQFSITPSTGALSAEAPVQTDNYPWGVAVK